MADWQAIKAEYITTDTSYRKLAKKYDVGYQAICHRSKEEGWIAEREQYTNKTVSKAIEKISSKQAEKLTRINSLADKLLEKLEQAVGELDKVIIVHKEKVEEGNTETTTEYREAQDGGLVDRAGLRQLTAALKDIKEVQMLQSELDRREQEARIANLQKQAEKEDEQGNNAPTLIIEGLPEEFKA